MTISQVGTATTFFSNSSVTTVTNNKPTGTAADDLLFWVVVQQNNASIATPSGWTAAQTSVTTTGLAVGVFYKIAGGSEPSDYSATTTSARAVGVLSAWRGVDLTTPLDTSAPTAITGTSSTTLPGITTVTADAVVLGVASNGYAGSSWSYTGTNADSTVGSIVSTNATGTNVGACVVLEAMPSTGSFTPTVTVSVSTARSIGQTFALRPASDPVEPTGQLQRESSFEALTDEWEVNGSGTLTFPTVGDAPHGSKVARLTATGSGNPYFQAEAGSDLLIPIEAEQIGLYLTAYAEYRWIGANTPNSTTRFNVYFLDSGFSTVSGGAFIGTPFTPDTDWERTQNNDNLIPAGSVWAALRPIINNAVSGDSIEVDQLYATIGDNIVNAGPHPDWEAHPEDTPLPDPPSITSITPDEGPALTEVTITGTDFTDVSSVTFDEVEADFTVDSDTQITATAPSGPVDGAQTVEVTGPGGSDTTTFTYVTPPEPEPDTEPERGILADGLRLEVQIAPEGLPNLLPNPSGENGAWGWSTPVSDTIMTTVAAGLRFTTNAAQAAHFLSEYLPLAEGEYVGARLTLEDMTAPPSGTPSIKCRFEFYDTTRSLLSSSTQTSAMTTLTTHYVNAVQAPADTVFVRFRVDFYNSGSTPGADTYVTFSDAMVTHGATAGELSSSRTNLVPNPSFETNTTGWSAVSVAGSVGSFSRITSDSEVGTACLELEQGVTNGVVRTAEITVPGGATYTYSVHARSVGATSSAAIRVIAYKSDGSVTGSTVNKNLDLTSTWDRYSKTFTVPSNAAKVRVLLVAVDGDARFDGVVLEQGSGVGTYFDGSTTDAGGYTYDWTGTAHNSASTQDAGTNYDFTDPQDWRNILGPTHEIQVSREELDVGTLTATVLDALLDPAESDVIRPGRDVRLMAQPEEGVWVPIFTGTIDAADVTYHLLHRDEGKRARITITATDNIRELANGARSEGVADIDDLPYVLEGAGVPWNVNGSGDQVATATIASENPNASAIDQVAITRDSARGYAWVDREGVLQVWDAATLDAEQDPVLVNDDLYNPDIDVSFNTADCINEVTIKWLRYKPSMESTEEVIYGPYRDAASIAEWGTRSMEFTIQGATEDAGDIEDFALAVLAANGTPQVRVNSVVIPIFVTTDGVLESFAPEGGTEHQPALLDLYSLVTVENAVKEISEESRIVGIEHTITPEKWLMTVRFAGTGSVASPQVTPSPSPNTGSSSNNPQSGLVTVTNTGANTWSGTAVTFDPPFVTVPNVTATWAPNSAPTNEVLLAVVGVSTTGFTMYAKRDNTTNPNVSWVAVV